MNAVISTNRFLHGREIAPFPTWEPTVPIAPSPRPPVGVSNAQRVLSQRERDVFLSFYPVTSYRLPLDLQFFMLAYKWKQDNLFESSPWRMAEHPAYKRIIKLGWPVVPMILRSLSEEADFWFEALVAITDEQPVPPEHAGDMEAMRQDWLHWGREHGYDF
jgi:hypothetical protein